MLRSFAATAVLMLLPCGFAQQHKRGPAPIPAKRAANTYEIYSLLLPGGPLDKISPTKAQGWAVADTTVNITDMNPTVPPNGLLKAPEDNQKAFEEALADFQSRRYERYQLTRNGFPRGHAPNLINSNQARDVRNSGQGGIIFFSAVYFNSNNTAALVYVNAWCANLCSAGQWVYLEKQSGHWVRRSGITVPGA